MEGWREGWRDGGRDGEGVGRGEIVTETEGHRGEREDETVGDRKVESGPSKGRVNERKRRERD